MTVLPYIMLALMGGIGKLTGAQSRLLLGRVALIILFLWFVGLWWIVWGLRRVEADLWSFFTLIFLLLGPCLLYLATTLLIPGVPEKGEIDLNERIETLGRAFFLCLIGFLLWLVTSEIWLLHDPWIVLPKRVFQTIALVLFGLGVAFPTRRVIGLTGFIALPLVVGALATVRSQLG